MERKPFNPIIIYLASTIILLVVFFLRFYYSLGFTQPYYILTSGCEEESLFSIWKFVHGKEVYTDFHQVPFAASYFNWGFYSFYGLITKATLNILNIGDEWIPQTGRIITFIGCIAGFIYAVKISKLIISPAKLSVLQLSLLISFFGGYIMGFWAITVRPDVWALASELAGFYYFIRYFKSSKLSNLVIAGVCFYIAWSFKQNFVSVAGGCIFFLLLRRRWKDFSFLSLMFFSLLLITYYLGGTTYQYLLVKSQAKMDILFSIGLANLKLGFLKSLPITLLALSILLFSLFKISLRVIVKRVYRNNYLLLLATCFSISFILFFAMAMKEGASDNYFFSPLIMLALFLIVAIQLLSNNYSTRKFASVTYSLICIMSITEGLLILSGKFGEINLRESSEKYEKLRLLASNLEKPLLVEKDSYANLPWVNNSDENFVLATTYYYKDRFNEPFEDGGVEGLMQKGYFNTIVSYDLSNTQNKMHYYLADSVITRKYHFYIWNRK